MSGADDLRLRIGKAAYERLSDPDLRLAIFDAMGLDVREAHEVSWSDGVSYGENYVQFHDVPNELREYVSPVLVARPRGEAT